MIFTKTDDKGELPPPCLDLCQHGMRFQALDAERQIRQTVFKFLCVDGNESRTIMMSAHKTDGSGS